MSKQLDLPHTGGLTEQERADTLEFLERAAQERDAKAKKERK